jgi:hypothetical protein
MATKTTKTTTLSNTWNADQSWWHEVHFTMGGSVCRTTIRRNAYDAQSTALAHRWDGGEWQVVAQVAAPLWPASVLAISYVHKDVTAEQFAPLVAMLATKVAFVLGA